MANEMAMENELQNAGFDFVIGSDMYNILFV